MTDGPKRITITVTPMTAQEFEWWLGVLRKKHGRKHLVHVIAVQPSDTNLADAPDWDV